MVKELMRLNIGEATKQVYFSVSGQENCDVKHSNANLVSAE